ncbi:SETX-like protein [Mya arenaria]|uniref:SETX-like protein n=1 Tax=Mya arenaria TaxID=6604 RepID=A0ABY7EA08_MYAAR|nr:SETX-like protein [Mya arenaria]
MAQFKRVDSNATTRSETSVSTVDEAGYSEIDAFLESEAEPAPNESNAVNVSEPGEDDEAENIQMDLESALFEHFEEGSEDSMEDIDESNMLDEQHHLNQSLKKRKNKSETSDTSEDDEGIANAERDKRKNKYEKTIGSAKTEEKNDGDKVHSSSQERGKQSRRRPASSKAKKNLVESGGEGDVEDNISVFNLDPPSEDEELSPSQDLFADLIHGKHRDCQQVPNISHPVREENDEKNQNDLDLQGKSLCTLFNNETQGYISPSGGVDECVENRNAETSNPEQEQEKVKCKTGEDKEEAEVKDEPVWLKFGYTQEPDTIFLSDGDDDIIMSFSQPIIDLVSSDEENVQSNPEDSSKFGETQAFEVRVKAEDDDKDYPEPSQICHDDNDLLDMEYFDDDWSDKGSDFDPNDIFDTSRNVTRSLGMDGNDLYISSDEDIFQSQSNSDGIDVKTELQMAESETRKGISDDITNEMPLTETDKKQGEPESDETNDFASGDDEFLEFDVLTQRDPLKKTNDIFVASTQASPTNNVKMSKKNVYHTPTLMDDLVINLDEDSQESTQSEQSNHQDIRDYYQIATQAHEGKITDRHTADVPGNNPSRVTFHNNDDLTLIDEGDSDEASVDDVYLMETQVLDNRTAEDKNETDKYIVATQIDTNSRESTDSEKSIKNKDQYEVDTQLDDDFELDDLPDLVDSDPYMVATQIDRIDDEDGSLSVDSTGQGTKNRPSSALKRPRSDSIGNDKDQSAPKSGDSVLPFKKPKLALSVKKPVVIEPQKLKSVAEKRASGVVTKTPSVDHKTSTPSTSSNKHDNIMMIDANHGDMWLSKKIHTSRTDGKSSKPVKRKRHESAEDILKSKVAAAKSRQKERMMQTIINPATIADKVRQKPVTSVPEFVDDVELPTNSQIVNQGLPLLNPMGILPKKTPHAYSGPSHRGKTSSASVTTTTVSIATGSTSTSSRPQPTTVTATTSSTVSISAASSLKMSETGKAMDKHVLKKDQHQKRKHEDDNSKDEKRHGKDKHRGKSEEKGSYKQADITKKIAQRTDRSQSKDNTQEKGNKQDKSKSYKGNDDHKGRHRHESGKEDHHEKDKNRRKSGSQSKENAERRENKTKGGINREKVASTSGGASTVTNKVPSGSQSEDNAKRRKNKTRGGISRENVASNSGGASTVTNKVPSGSQSKENAERRENMTKGGISRENVASSSGGASFVTNKVPSGSQSKENAERRENKTNDGISREIVSSTSGGASSVTKVQSVTSHIITSTTSVTRPTAHVSSAILLQKKPSGSQHPSNIPARTGPMTSVYRQQSNTAGQQTRTPFSLNQGNTPGKVVHGNKENMPPNMVDKNALLLWNDFLKVILKWTPDWFEEKDKMEKSGQKKIPPPPVTNDLRGHNEHQLFALIDRYLSYSDYSDRFMLPLLLHETWESCYNEWREGKSKSRCAPHNMMLSNMEATKNKSMAIYVLHGLVDERDRSRGNYSSEGDLVKLVVQGQMKVAGMKPMEYKMTGYIEKVTFSEFSVEKLCSHNQQIGKSRPRHAISMTMRILIRSRPFMPDTNCLVSVETESAIVNTRRQFNALAHLATNPLCPHLLFPTHNPTYTDTAPASIGLKSRAINSAVKISLLPDNLPRIILLQGPPGTGKSHTIIGIIKKIVQASNGQGRVCLCAPSHSAIDELLRRLVKHNRDNPGCEIRVVRLGKKCSPDIQHLLLDRQVQMNVLQAYKEKQVARLPASLQGERQSLGNKIRTLRGNLATAVDTFQRTKLKNDLRKLEREKDVIESKCAIDMATQAIELDTLIPLQYGSTKLVLVGDPEQLPPTVLSQAGIPSPVILLNTQYRMDPQIAHFPSNYVYEGRIKNDVSVLDRSACPLVPYLLYNIVEGQELFSQHSRELEHIEVSTVDAFQGREKHVIIMSCVRANTAKNIGFVGSRNRMNVALTRAKYAMYLGNDEWNAVISDARQRKKVVRVDESTVSYALQQSFKTPPTQGSGGSKGRNGN